MVSMVRRKYWLILGMVLIFLVSSIVAAAYLSNNASAPVTLKQSSVEKPQPRTISSNILFLGNTYWGRYINDWSMASPLKYKYPFSRLNEFNRESYDAWISGLECPTVAGVDMSSAEEDSTLTFNCSPNYLPEASKWFNAFTLANNHTDNQGADGFAETKQQLDKVGIQYFGNPDPKVTDDVCEVIGLPVTVKNDNESVTKGSLPIAMCAYHGVFQIPPAESVAVMKKYSLLMPVVAMPHMGKEYQSAPDQIKTDFYRRLIDGGADMVLGDHPHWIQTSEGYKGHLIVYSMGNFMFDQQDTPEVIRSAGIQVVLKTMGESSSDLQKWLAIGKTCSVFKDGCLEQIKAQQLSKLAIDYQFGVIGTNDSGKIVKPATADQLSSILNRLDWYKTTSQLQAPYSGL